MACEVNLLHGVAEVLQEARDHVATFEISDGARRTSGKLTA